MKNRKWALYCSTCNTDSLKKATNLTSLSWNAILIDMRSINTNCYFFLETTDIKLLMSWKSKELSWGGSSRDHDDIIKWKHFLHYWPFVWGIHRSPMNSPQKGKWSGALMFSLICARLNSWVNNGEAGDLRCHRAHYDVTLMMLTKISQDIPVSALQWLTLIKLRIKKSI